MPNPSKPNQRRNAALMVTFAGAAISLAQVLRAGSRNQSIILVLLFVVWVLSPFVGLISAIFASAGWAALVRNALYWIAIAITLFSLALYGGLVSPAGNKMTAVFLMVPLFSWVIGAIVVILARLFAKRNA